MSKRNHLKEYLKEKLQAIIFSTLAVGIDIAKVLGACLYEVFDLEGTGDLKCPCCRGKKYVDCG